MSNISKFVEEHKNQGFNLFESSIVEEIKNNFNNSELEKVEAIFSSVLDEIKDNELKFKIDSAMGRIAAVYERHGFCIGYIAALAFKEYDFDVEG